MAAVSILGLGDVLMGDEAFGPHLIRRLQAFYRFGPAVRLFEARAIGLNVLPKIAGSDALIVVDTLPPIDEPGVLRLYRRDTLPISTDRRGSSCELGLREALQLLEFTGGAPASVLLVAVVRGEATARLSMSPPVDSAIARAEAEILGELTRLGQPPLRSWTSAAASRFLESQHTS